VQRQEARVVVALRAEREAQAHAREDLIDRRLEPARLLCLRGLQNPTVAPTSGESTNVTTGSVMFARSPTLIATRSSGAY